MARREINVRIGAENRMSRGIRSVKSTLASLGRSVVNVGRTVATGMLAAGAAVAGFAAKAIHSYAQKETATNSLVSALQAHGEESDALVPKLQKVADEIQNQTGVADENTIATMANLRMLGVQTDALGEAAKGVIALESAGLRGAAAERAMAAAMQGNYSMLTRYIPALRNATTEQEKAAIVSDFLNRGYDQQQAALNTVSGAFRAFRERVSDVWAEVGRAISSSGALTGMLHRASDAVKAFGERVRAYVDSERFQSVQRAVEGIVEAVRQGGEARREVFQALSDVIVSAFRLAATTAMNIISNAAGYLGRKLGAAIRNAALSTSRGRQIREHREAAETAEIRTIEMRVRTVGADEAQRTLEDLGYTAIEASEMVAQAQSNIERSDREMMRSRDSLSASINNLMNVGQAYRTQASDDLRAAGTLNREAANIVVGSQESVQQAVRETEESYESAAKSSSDYADEAKHSAEIIHRANEEAAENIGLNFESMRDRLSEVNDSRVQNEKRTLDRIVGINEEAAKKNKATWGPSTSSFEVGRWSEGGSVVSRNQALPPMPVHGSGMAGFSVHSGVNAQIHRQLETMNHTLSDIKRNEERLLTLG